MFYDFLLWLKGRLGIERKIVDTHYHTSCVLWYNSTKQTPIPTMKEVTIQYHWYKGILYLY